MTTTSTGAAFYESATCGNDISATVEDDEAALSTVGISRKIPAGEPCLQPETRTRSPTNRPAKLPNTHRATIRHSGWHNQISTSRQDTRLRVAPLNAQERDLFSPILGSPRRRGKAWFWTDRTANRSQISAANRPPRAPRQQKDQKQKGEGY